MVPLLEFEVAGPRARSLNNPCADWTDDSHNDAVDIFQWASQSAVFACRSRQINPSTGIRFLVKFGSSRLPRLTLNAAVCSEIQVPRVMLGGGAKKGSRGGGWAQGRHIVS